MRKLALSQKKERGIKRKLRNLSQWSDSFKGYFPDLNDNSALYYNWKIPVSFNMIQGKHAEENTRVICAQYLINACRYLIDAKPDTLSFCKVTCCIVLTDMFASEICIYLDKDYFGSHTCTGNYTDSKYSFSPPKSLSEIWQLDIPNNMYEHGIHFEYLVDFDSNEKIYAEHWFYCEK